MKRLIAPLLGLALAGIGSTANAALLVYTTEASFLAAVSAPGIDNYNGFPIDQYTASPVLRTAGAYGYTASAANGFYGVGTTANPWLSTISATDLISFSTFTGGVSAIGGNFFATDFGGAYTSASITLVATDSSGFLSRTITNATTGSFLGFISSSVLQSLSVTLLSGMQSSFPTVDNLVLATSQPSNDVPEPATMALLGLGMAGLMLSRRKNRK